LAFAQSVNGLISGVVLDDQRAAVTVEIPDELNTTSQTTETDENGYFVFPGLRPGKYTLFIEKHGFGRFEKKDMLVFTADWLFVGTITPRIGPATEVVAIISEGPVVET
jgi:hypothetical protein